MQKRYWLVIPVFLSLMLVIVSPWAFGVNAAQMPGEPEIPWAIPLFFPIIRNDPTATPPPTLSPTPTVTPTPTTPPPTPTSTPQPDGVYLSSDRGYRSGSSYYVFAEVVNGLNEQVCDVEAVARFYDNNGALVATESGSTMLFALSPQQRAPIKMLVWSAPSSLAYYTLEFSWRTRCSLKYRNVTVLNQNIRDTSRGAEVFGEVRNDNPETMNSVMTAVTFYDASGRIWYADYEPLEGSTELAPSQVGVYNIRTLEKNLVSLPYLVQAQGYSFNSAQ